MSESTYQVKSSRNQTPTRTKTPQNNHISVQTKQENDPTLTPSSPEYQGMRPGAIMANIKRTIDSGNYPVNSTRVQPKLTIGAPGDRYEQEADRVASDVVQKISLKASPPATYNGNGSNQSILRVPPVQRVEAQEPLQPKLYVQRQPEEEELQAKFIQREARDEQEDNLQMKGFGLTAPNIQADFESTLNSARSGGSPLDQAFRAKVEPAMGADFSSVRVHTDSQANDLSQSIQAKAFTTGNHIFMKQGQYDPNSKSGQELLAHELTHVVQQDSGVIGIQTNHEENKIDTLSQTTEPIIQKMSIVEGKNVVDTVRSFVPRAGNRLFDIVATGGKSIDKNALTNNVLQSIDNLHPFGTTDITDISTRAAVAKTTKGAVCDNYQEMVIAEMDRRWGAGNDVHGEHYPGHSYVSVKDPISPTDPREDLIVDAWRNIVDKRKNFHFFRKYKTEFQTHPKVNMTGTTDWLTGNGTNVGEYYVRGYLNLNGWPDTGNLRDDLNSYIKAHPDNLGLERLKYIFPL